MIKVFVSGKYSAENRDLIEKNVIEARELGAKLMKLGYQPYVPHTLYDLWDEVEDLNWDAFMDNTLAWLKECDAILMMDNWKESPGAVIEHDRALDFGLPVFYSINDLQEHYDIYTIKQEVI